MTDLNRPLLGEPNAPCRTCGAPLAADQRYCLNCGNRRAEARLPFLDVLAQQVPADSAAATTTTTTRRGPHGLFTRMSSNAAAVAGVACLVLALGVGVLIGGLGSDDTSASAAPQVISVGGAAAPAAAAAPSTTAPAATDAAPAAAAGATAAKSKAKKKAASASSSGGSKATNSTVKNLDKSSGADYSKKSAKLPKQVGTGGKAPPKDTSGKAIGGGSDVETIG
jgi:hypothetical protein